MNISDLMPSEEISAELAYSEHINCQTTDSQLFFVQLKKIGHVPNVKVSCLGLMQ